MRRAVIPRHVDYFEIGVFTFSALYGITTLVNYTHLATRSVQLYPGIGGVTFLAMLAVGGLTGLASFLFTTITGPKLELASLTLLVVLCLAYTVWTPFSVGAQGVGLLLSLAVLIAGPGYFARRRLAKYVNELEDIEKGRRLGGRENGARERISMGRRGHRRRRHR